MHGVTFGYNRNRVTGVETFLITNLESQLECKCVPSQGALGLEPPARGLDFFFKQ